MAYANQIISPHLYLCFHYLFKGGYNIYEILNPYPQPVSTWENYFSGNYELR